MIYPWQIILLSVPDVREFYFKDGNVMVQVTTTLVGGKTLLTSRESIKGKYSSGCNSLPYDTIDSVELLNRKVFLFCDSCITYGLRKSAEEIIKLIKP